MENQHTSTPGMDHSDRIPTQVWLALSGIFIVAAAIFIFKVPLGTVGYFALIVLFMGSHLFMHAGHGGHGGHGFQGSEEQASSKTTNIESDGVEEQSNQGRHTNHSNGCH